MFSAKKARKARKAGFRRRCEGFQPPFTPPAHPVVLVGVVIFAALGGCDQGTEPAPSPEQQADHATETSSQTLNPALAETFRLIERNQTEPARERLAVYLRDHPHDGQAVFLLGLSYHREKKYHEARSYFEQAILHAPNYYLIHHFHGWAMYYLGDLENSRAEFETFLTHQLDEPDSIFALGLIALDEARLEEAEQRFRRSIELLSGSSSPSAIRSRSKAHARLGDVYEQRGELARARTELETACRLYPDHYEALYKLYRLLVRLGEDERASQTYQAYLATRQRLYPGTRFPE